MKDDSREISAAGFTPAIPRRLRERLMRCKPQREMPFWGEAVTPFVVHVAPTPGVHRQTGTKAGRPPPEEMTLHWRFHGGGVGLQPPSRTS